MKWCQTTSECRILRHFFCKSISVIWRLSFAFHFKNTWNIVAIKNIASISHLDWFIWIEVFVHGGTKNHVLKLISVTETSMWTDANFLWIWCVVRSAIYFVHFNCVSVQRGAFPFCIHLRGISACVQFHWNTRDAIDQRTSNNVMHNDNATLEY